jgi:hypothetical protein
VEVDVTGGRSLFACMIGLGTEAVRLMTCALTRNTSTRVAGLLGKVS